jgi:hypothetical protein
MPEGTSTHQPPVAGGATVITPVSAQTSAALTEEQRRERYKELRSRIGRPRLEVVGDPTKHYFWGPRGDSNELDRLDLIGYRIVREPNVKNVLEGKAQPRVKAAGLREDGTYVLGDVILLECDMEVYEFLILENEQKSSLNQQAAKDNFVFESEKQGVPVFEVDKSRVGGK